MLLPPGARDASAGCVQLCVVPRPRSPRVEWPTSRLELLALLVGKPSLIPQPNCAARSSTTRRASHGAHTITSGGWIAWGNSPVLGFFGRAVRAPTAPAKHHACGVLSQAEWRVLVRSGGAVPAPAEPRRQGLQQALHHVLGTAAGRRRQTQQPACAAWAQDKGLPGRGRQCTDSYRVARRCSARRRRAGTCNGGCGRCMRAGGHLYSMRARACEHAGAVSLGGAGGELGPMGAGPAATYAQFNVGRVTPVLLKGVHAGGGTGRLARPPTQSALRSGRPLGVLQRPVGQHGPICDKPKLAARSLAPFLRSNTKR